MIIGYLDPWGKKVFELAIQVCYTYSLHCSSFLVNQNLYYRILAIKLVNQKKEVQWKL